MNLPNKLTMLRIILIPVFLVLVLVESIPLHYLWALIVFLAACITDTLDGHIARSRNLVTDFGKLMDPLADKLMVLSVMLGWVLAGTLPWPAMAILLGKELLMVAGGAFLLRRGIVVYAEKIGKYAQTLMVSSLILAFFGDWFNKIGFPLHLIVLWCAVALTLSALAYYAANAVRMWNQAAKEN